MGGLLSTNEHRPTDTFFVPHSKSCKRQKASPSSWDGNPPLISGLPDEISLAILARVPRIYYLNVKAVSRSWKAAVTSPEIYKVRKELGTTEEWLYILTRNQRVQFFWHALDPVSKKWQKLPPIPNAYAEEVYIRYLPGSWMCNMAGSSIRIPYTMRGWPGWMDDSYHFLFRGCATGAVDGCLYVLGGIARGYTMTCVWKYDPVSNSWSKSNSMSVARAYSKTGVLNNKLFVVGGKIQDRDHGGDTPIQSAEVYDPQTGLWSDLPSISFSKAHALQAANSEDLLKPFATGLISYRRKLFVPQCLRLSPSGVDFGGQVYDPETNSWADMPRGMIEGWPVSGTGTEMSVNVDDDLYALDRFSSLVIAKINHYNHEDDSWKMIDGEVPVPDFYEPGPPCLVAGLLGKLHVITKDDNYDIVVMRVDKQNDLITSSGEGTSEPNILSVIASMNATDAKFVSCQTLDI